MSSIYRPAEKQNKKIKNQLSSEMWLAFKFVLSRKFLIDGSALLSIFGLILGVAALIVSQAVMRGFEDSLQKAMVDVTADIQLVKRGRLLEDWPQFKKKITELSPEIVGVSRFTYAEAVFAHQGQVSGVLVQGLDLTEAFQILNFKNRLSAGQLLSGNGQIVIGQGLSKKHHLKIGDRVYLAVPISTSLDSNSFRRQTAEFQVVGVIDFGKNEWNERLILSEISDLQKLIDVGQRFTGTFMKIKDSSMAPALSLELSEKLGPQFSVMNWYDVNRNLFEAVAYEKPTLFFVVFLIVIVAAFNISSTLYVHVRQRYKDISILKTLGLGAKHIQRLFMFQGFVVATISSVLGGGLGILLSQVFMFLQSRFSLISGAVYKIDRIDISIQSSDFLIVYLATLAACLVASRSPAVRAGRLQIMDGLREYS